MLVKCTQFRHFYTEYIFNDTIYD